MFYKESRNFLSEESKDFINKIVLGDNFPFHNQFTNCAPNEFFLSHTVLERTERRDPEKQWNSFYYKHFVKMCDEFFKQNEININKYFRMCVNFTFNNGLKRHVTHEDHNFPHKQLIIVLNDPSDSNAATVILAPDKKMELKRVKPLQYKGICFDSHPHYQIMPRFGYRIALIVTFDEKEK